MNLQEMWAHTLLAMNDQGIHRRKKRNENYQF